jgi:hypothetical protein
MRWCLLVVLIGAGLGASTGNAATDVSPGILGVTATPRALPAAGGSLVLAARVRNATTCTFASSAPSFNVTVPCATGNATVTVHLAANQLTTALQLRYSIQAVGTGGRAARRQFGVTQAGVPVANSAVTASPLTIVSTPLPSALGGVAYTAALSASGGSPPYVWSVTSGTLPAGLSLSPSGTITGTPNAIGPSSFTVGVTDSTAAAAAGAVSLQVLAPRVLYAHSNNWSGYSVVGGPFTVAAGTFTVPSLSASPTTATTSEWVGVDGGPGQRSSLIQAGVTESYDASTQLVTTYAWWEILPSSETRIALPVAPGDQMTVTVGQVSPTVWGIWLTDDTTGQTFSTEQPWSTVGGSVDWIVEAPTSASSGTLDTLGQYTPGVTFSNLGMTGASASTIQWGMVQSGALVSVPSALTTAGFSVAYGSAPPPPPG